jgi:putative intracellular protease/amidase
MQGGALRTTPTRRLLAVVALALALAEVLPGCGNTAVRAPIERAAPAPAASGKVLVILSSATRLELRDGKDYGTGYYLAELAVPLRRMVDTGFTPVFANPRGNPVSFDPASNDKLFFGGDEAARARAVAFLVGIAALKHPRTLASIEAEGTAGYTGVFIPGGHAPMQDLIEDRTLGGILVAFHASGRPTGILCHGPIALLSTVSDPVAFRKAMAAGDTGAASSIARGWPYAGYRLTVFSSSEESALEGQSRQLGGRMLFYASDALAQAGAHVDQVAQWQVNVVEDRELVTGQQPFSAEEFGRAFVAKLEASRAGTPGARDQRQLVLPQARPAP